MPVPSLTANSSADPGPSSSPKSPPDGSESQQQKPKAGSAPSQKSMTKAERRELQEKQRAAKVAAKQQPGASSEGGGKGKASGSSSQKRSSVVPSDAPGRQQLKDAGGDGPTPGTTGAGKAVAVLDDLNAIRGSRIFSHFGVPNPIGHVKGDVHPSIIRLGLLFSEFKICGANARCIAALTAFKTVIQDYTTPSDTTLSRHLLTHLSRQIKHLLSARPMPTSMGNAIRQLKLAISSLNFDLPEQDAKDSLCQKIDDYIRDRIIIADEVIQEFAGKKIKEGDVILTYARSSVVEKVLLNAHEEGKRFSVIVVDSRPLLEGKSLLRKLTSCNPPIPCTYTVLPALPSVINEATTVLVGANALCANGAVYSRAGTALVAMMAKTHNIPFMVCCETYKFHDGVMLDGFGKNELIPKEVSISPSNDEWQTRKLSPNLEVLNPLYDLTPPTSITVVVTEVGLIPPSSISSIPLALGRGNMEVAPMP